MNQLNEEKNKNQKLLEQLSIEQKKVEELNEKIKLYDLTNIKDKDESATIKSEDEIIAIYLTSVNEEIQRPISCKNTDAFSKIEEKIYNEYPKYKDYNTYFTINGNEINKFKTLEENKIKDGNTIVININDK